MLSFTKNGPHCVDIHAGQHILFLFLSEKHSIQLTLIILPPIINIYMESTNFHSLITSIFCAVLTYVYLWMNSKGIIFFLQQKKDFLSLATDRNTFRKHAFMDWAFFHEEFYVILILTSQTTFSLHWISHPQKNKM